MQILPGVHLINGFAYGCHQNGYLVQTDDAPFVVDSGDMEGDSFGTVVAGCARWGFRVEEVGHLLVTHAHFDHASHAARFRRAGAKIVASQDTADAIELGDDRCIGYAMGSTFEPCPADVVAGDGGTLHIGGVDVPCIAAPGHADGLMVYEIVRAGERVWFCGDLVEVGPECRDLKLGWAGGPDYDRSTYLATLRRLRDMEFDSLLPGHGPPALGFGSRLIDQAYTKAMPAWR